MEPSPLDFDLDLKLHTAKAYSPLVSLSPGYGYKLHLSGQILRYVVLLGDFGKNISGNDCLMYICYIFASLIAKGSVGRVVRQWSAKPCTAVQIRYRPHIKSLCFNKKCRLFFCIRMLPQTPVPLKSSPLCQQSDGRPWL